MCARERKGFLCLRERESEARVEREWERVGESGREWERVRERVEEKVSEKR